MFDNRCFGCGVSRAKFLSLRAFVMARPKKQLSLSVKTAEPDLVFYAEL